MAVRAIVRFAGLVLAAGCLLAVFSVPAEARTLPPGFTDSLFVGGLSSPTAMDFAPDGRLFVTEKFGNLRVVKNGALLSTPFLTVSVNAQGERGLLGITFDPDFTNNQYVYIYYTVPTAPIHNRVSRFTANGDVAVPSSEVVLLDLDNLSTRTNHNGGAIHFGPDGKLYVAVGENANGGNSQSLNTILGKILRLNSDGTIPSDNPFYGQTTGKNQAIWAMGLRNPYTFAFDPVTNRMFINDVGQSTWEEINDGLAGSNYGWPNTEGPTNNPAYVTPLYYYGHNPACAITGGAFYNPPSPVFPSPFIGDYFFADYCGNWIRVYDIASDTATSFVTSTAASPVDLKVSPFDGALYYLAYGAGQVHRVTYAPPNAPTLISPLNGGTTANRRPIFSWNNVASATRYEITLMTVGSSAPLVVKVNRPSIGNPSYIPPGNLLLATYQWSVRAQDTWGGFSAPSVIRTVTIAGTATTTPAVNLVTTSTPTLTWTDVPGNLGYQIQIDNNAGFGSPEVNDATIPAGTNSTTVATPLPDGLYYWRVRANMTATSWGAWSAAQMLTVDVP
jgi:glucose/arabinose dehydrogenase